MTFYIITLNVLCWILIQGAGFPPFLQRSVVKFGLIPREIFSIFFKEKEISGSFFTYVINNTPKLYTIFTSMFMHGGWFHLISNMWFLAVFGDNVEDVMGSFKFFLFYILCGIGAFVVHSILNLSSSLPMVGASGAISGVLGAYFILYPRAPVYTLLFFGWIWTVIFPAWFLIGYWFLLQIIGGIPSLFISTGGIAFWAHIGGFLTGIFLVRFFIDPVRFEERRRCLGCVKKFYTPVRRSFFN